MILRVPIWLRYHVSVRARRPFNPTVNGALVGSFTLVCDRVTTLADFEWHLRRKHPFAIWLAWRRA